MLEDNAQLGLNVASLPFLIRDRLIYYRDPDRGDRLCVPDYNGLVREMFQQAHNEAGHPDYTRTHKRLIQTLYIRRLPSLLHEFIRHCPSCKLNQTPRHRPYGFLQSILLPPEPFYMITLDFILALPQSRSDGYN